VRRIRIRLHPELPVELGRPGEEAPPVPDGQRYTSRWYYVREILPSSNFVHFKLASGLRHGESFKVAAVIRTDNEVVLRPARSNRLQGEFSVRPVDVNLHLVLTPGFDGAQLRKAVLVPHSQHQGFFGSVDDHGRDFRRSHDHNESGALED
jgi:hypothetical protein